MNGRKMKWLRHAFAVEESGPADPTDDQQKPVDRLCYEAVKRGLTTPALVTLELTRPLNFIASQSMYFMHPAVDAIAPPWISKHFKETAGFLERRGSLEYMARRIEAYEELAKEGRLTKPGAEPHSDARDIDEQAAPTTAHIQADADQQDTTKDGNEQD